jgi:hypothetical protein
VRTCRSRSDSDASRCASPGRADAGARHFLEQCRKPFLLHQRQRLQALLLKADRWQFIDLGICHPDFQRVVGLVATAGQRARILCVLAPVTATSH